MGFFTNSSSTSLNELVRLVTYSIYTYLSETLTLEITGPGGWPRTVGHDLKFESPGGNDAGSSFSASRRDATRRMSATELVCASPSQQRLRRSSVAAALRAP